MRRKRVPAGIAKRSRSDAGYVLLFKINDKRTVTVVAARHQRENDFY